MFQGEEGPVARAQSEDGHSRNVSDSFKAQAKNTILLHIFYFYGESFYLFFYFKQAVIAH